MFYLAINRIRENVKPEDIGKIVPGHIAWIREKIAAGTIMQAGKWGQVGGMAILKAGSLEEAEGILKDDPLIISGLIDTELYDFYPDVEFR